MRAAVSTFVGLLMGIASLGCARASVVPGVTVAPYPAPQTQAYTPPVPYAPPSAIEHVQLIAGMPAATCEVIGLVTAIARPGDGDVALDELRARAAALGADAVVHVRLHVESSPGDESVSGDPEWEAMLDEAAGTWEQGVRVTGEAVRYREPIVEGRRYLVVGHISVTDRVGHEHEALERLASRARTMRADLVIDIEVESHGPDSPFEVHGTAIRFLE